MRNRKEIERLLKTEATDDSSRQRLYQMRRDVRKQIKYLTDDIIKLNNLIGDSTTADPSSMFPTWRRDRLETLEALNNSMRKLDFLTR